MQCIMRNAHKDINGDKYVFYNGIMPVGDFIKLVRLCTVSGKEESTVFYMLV